MANTLTRPSEGGGTALAPLPTSEYGDTNTGQINGNSAPATSSTPSPTPPSTTLPELPYSLRQHKLSIAIIWTLLALDSAIMPLALFYPLWFSSGLDPAYIFAVTTGVFGIITGLEWCYRSWQLWKKEDARPFGGKRNGFDFFHISYTTGYAIALVELIIGAAPHDPFVRVCAMPAPSFILFFSFLLLSSTIFPRNPFRISSQAKGAPMRAFTYTIIEDVIAVDTGSGRTYRKAIDERWKASPLFRAMLWQLNMFWGLSGLLIGAGCTAVVATTQIDQTIAYGIGWGVPPVWAIIWALITTMWAQVALRKEKEVWAKAETRA